MQKLLSANSSFVLVGVKVLEMNAMCFLMVSTLSQMPTMGFRFYVHIQYHP